MESQDSKAFIQLATGGGLARPSRYALKNLPTSEQFVLIVFYMHFVVDRLLALKRQRMIVIVSLPVARGFPLRGGSAVGGGEVSFWSGMQCSDRISCMKVN